MKSTIFNTVLRGRKVVLTALVLTAMAASAYADPVTIINGNFSSTSGTGSRELSNGSYFGQNVSNWTNASGAYNFVFTSPSASAPDQYSTFFNPDTVSFYSPHNSPLTASPAGGNFLALDSDYNQGAISQTIHGLQVGDLVTVSFYFAGAQQTGYGGASTDYLQVSLGGQTENTITLDDPSHGFTGWNKANLTFTATSTSEVLSFLAVGTPTGVPSFALLDGVSATQTSPVPEPASLALLSTGLIGIGGLVRRRFSK